ncbi:MAG: tetratricopeptide repeat protein [Bacteroidales bacterium]
MKTNTQQNKKTLKHSPKPNVSGHKPAGIKTQLPWFIFVFLLSFLLYSGTFGHDYVLDDSGVIEKNRIVKMGLDGIPTIFKTPYRFGVNMLDDNLYRPFSLAMFAVEWQIAPNKPMIGHLVNVIFYALSSVLLLLVLFRLFRRHNPAIPIFATLLWIVHPIHTEVVANIKSRDEIMSVFFLLLTVNWFISFNLKKNLLWLAASLVSYFFALMSKEGAITFLAIMPLVGWYISENPNLKQLRITGLFLIPAILFLVIRQAVLSEWASSSSTMLIDNLLIGAPDFQSRMATAIMLLGKYLFLLFAPVKLVSDYSYNQIPVTNWLDPYVLLSFVVYGGAMVFAFLRLKIRDLLSFGILFFLLTMSVYSNIFMIIGSSFAERFLYLPSIGFSFVIAALLLKVFKMDSKEQVSLKFSAIFRKMKGPSAIMLIILLLFGFQTISRNRDWKNGYTLFSQDVKKSPQSAHMHIYWGMALREKALEEKDPQQRNARMEKALEEFKKAAVIYPNYPDAWQQIALAYFRLGNNELSLESYQKALTLNPNEPTTYGNMGIIFFQKGDINQAIELYQKALKLDASYADAYLNLGSCYGTKGDYANAVDNFLKCIQLEPENARANYFLGITYKSLNNAAEAKRYLDTAAQLDPSFAK